MEKLQKLGVFTLFFTFLFIVLAARNVYSCFPAGPDPWFTTILTFDQATLPNGIEIVETDSTYEPYTLINNNTEPFYLVRENTTDWETFPNSELPKNFEPRFKITANRVYFWGISSSRDVQEGWKPNSGGVNNSAATRVGINNDIYILEGETRQIYQDNRPEELDLPSPQNFKILGFYKGKPVEIKGTLSYSLNENYDPQKFAKGVEACRNWSQSINSPWWKIQPFIYIVIIGILSALGYRFYKIITKSKK